MALLVFLFPLLSHLTGVKVPNLFGFPLFGWLSFQFSTFVLYTLIGAVGYYALLEWCENNTKEVPPDLKWMLTGTVLGRFLYPIDTLGFLIENGNIGFIMDILYVFIGIGVVYYAYEKIWLFRRRPR